MDQCDGKTLKSRSTRKSQITPPSAIGAPTRAKATAVMDVGNMTMPHYPDAGPGKIDFDQSLVKEDRLGIGALG